MDPYTTDTEERRKITRISNSDFWAIEKAELAKRQPK